MFKNTATARALKEMQASLTILWLRKRLGLCSVELDCLGDNSKW